MAERPKYQTKVLDRVRTSFARFVPVLEALAARSANESDTVAVITDMLSDAFGWQKYVDVTSELRIKGQFCDLVLRSADRMVAILEAKSINTKLSRSHLYQAVSYAANQGVDWIILTNGRHWELYRLIIGKPLDQQLIAEFDATDVALQDTDLQDMDAPWLLCKEAFERGALQEVFERISAINGTSLAQFVLSSSVLKRLRLEIRDNTDFNVSVEEIRHLLCKSVLRPEVVPQVVRPESREPAAAGSNTAAAPTASATAANDLPRKQIGLADLHAAGLLRDGERLLAKYKGKDFDAVFRAPDSIEVMGATYDSLSEATQPVVRTDNPQNTGRNGWDFWHAERDGARVPLSDLRAQLAARTL
jgi:predicted type IV restriction endonuclease